MGARRGTVRTRTATTIAAITRHNGPEDPRLPELQRDLRAAMLEEHIQRVVAEAPPLTDDQRARLAGLLGGA
jgi:hypothetical protein